MERVRSYLYDYNIPDIIDECLANCKNKKTQTFLESLQHQWDESEFLTEPQLERLTDIYEEIYGRD